MNINSSAPVALLACPHCGQAPEFFEEELSTHMECTIRCPEDFQSYGGTFHWVVKEWTEFATVKANASGQTREE